MMATALPWGGRRGGDRAGAREGGRARTRVLAGVRVPGLVAAFMALSACGGGDGDVRRPPGDPLPGLTEAELTRFQWGRELFDRQWTPEQGLGPLFMQPGCGSCHDLPTIGFAPGREELAHSNREEIVLKDLFKATEFYALFPFTLIEG